MDLFKVNKDECRVEECERQGIFHSNNHNYSVYETLKFYFKVI